ncbi:MAG: redox-sensing transcriptional repressor Rex [Bacteroidetes bacterium]|nr:MAG: redox-sensing transcriptional repressor Rex [Bacteroidota bacterium]
MLPAKTIERLSQYRRTLLRSLEKGKLHIFSHELADLHNITAVQVRRDIMLIGYTGQLRKGYNIKKLIEAIGKIIDSKNCQNIAIIGIGNLGKAITSYFNGKRSNLKITVAFDTNPDKVGKIISGVKCYHINDLIEIIKEQDISIGIITTPPDNAVDIAEKLTMAGIKGILNFTTTPINVSPNVCLEEYDMVTSIEKLSYFIKNKNV